MKTNTIITKTFTYDIPDDYLHQTTAKSLTGSFTYEGPDKLWIFINKETNKMQGSLVYTEKEDGADIPVSDDTYKVCIDANVNPEIASLIWNAIDYSTLPTIAEDLPDGTKYIRPASPPPDHTYELTECEYDPVAGAWVKPLPWKQPHMSWDELKTARTMLLSQTDKTLATLLLTDEQRAAWDTYRQALRDLPELFAGIDPWKVPFPVEPVTGA
jgi:hypothetical protein